MPQPPWVNQPRVSSSGRPGPCMTPSRVMLSKAVIVAIALYLSCRIMRRHTHDDRACVRWTPDRDFRPRKARWNFEVDFYSLNIKNEEIHSRCVAWPNSPGRRPLPSTMPCGIGSPVQLQQVPRSCRRRVLPGHGWWPHLAGHRRRPEPAGRDHARDRRNCADVGVLQVTPEALAVSKECAQL